MTTTAPASILVVEDSADFRETTVRVLNEGGYQAVSARGAKQALARLRALGPKLALVLTDVNLDGQDGFALAGEVWTLRPDVMILFMSGHDVDVVKSTGVDPTRAAFIQKPFTPAEIARAIAALLARRDARGGS